MAAQNPSAVDTINQSTTISVIPTADEWTTIHQMAQALLPTGFLPNTIKTPEQATAIILKGRELNIPPMYALSNIVVVQGKPTANAELMLALVQRDHGIDAMWVDESTNEHCTVGYRIGRKERSYTFTIEDAEQAGLFKNQVWKQYPAAMLRARCISAVARMAFPGSIAGMYVAGELGEATTVSPDGEVRSVSETTEQAPQSQSYGEPEKWGPGTGGGPAQRVDRETGAIVDVQARPARQRTTATVEPVDWEQEVRDGAQRVTQRAQEHEDIKLKQQKKTLWDLANGQFGWSKDQLNAVSISTAGVSLEDLDIDEAKRLYMELVGTSEDERAELIAGLAEAS